MSRVIRPKKGVLRIVCESPRPYGATKIKSSNEAFEILRKEYDDGAIEYQEQFKILMLSMANTIIGIAPISSGSGRGTIVDPKMVAQHAILAHASGVILCHNHPSGNLNPSNADKDLTERIRQGLKLFDIEILDHLVIHKDDYFSFADKGLL